MKPSIASVLVSCTLGFFLAAPAARADIRTPAPAHRNGSDSHGGDVFDLNPVGAGYQLWDMLEFGRAFDPMDTEAYAQVIGPRLAALGRKAPLLEAFVKRTFSGGATWAFVRPSVLATVQPTGDTNLRLTYNRVQAAISDPARYTIQIDEGIWASLSTESQAYLLLHEALWQMELAKKSYTHLDPSLRFVSDLPLFLGGSMHNYSVESAYPSLVNLHDISTTSQDIRQLTGLLLNPSLGNPDRYLLEDICDLLNGASGRVNQRTYGNIGGGPRTTLMGWNINAYLSRYGLEMTDYPFLSEAAGRTPLAVVCAADQSRSLPPIARPAPVDPRASYNLREEAGNQVTIRNPRYAYGSNLWLPISTRFNVLGDQGESMDAGNGVCRYLNLGAYVSSESRFSTDLQPESEDRFRLAEISSNGAPRVVTAQADVFVSITCMKTGLGRDLPIEGRWRGNLVESPRYRVGRDSYAIEPRGYGDMSEQNVADMICATKGYVQAGVISYEQLRTGRSSIVLRSNGSPSEPRMCVYASCLVIRSVSCIQ